jgi:prepilin-type processing-associated H-X9-DG protein
LAEDLKMTATSQSEPPVQAGKEKRPFQFGVRHLLAAMFVTAALLSLAHYVGFGVVVALAALFVSAARVVVAIRAGRAARFTLVELLACVAIIGMLIALLLPAVSPVRPQSRRAQCTNNLKQIALALHNYHSTHGSFPPAYVADASGRPMHSWRVLILPYLDHLPLYRQYRFDEPWDGPNNSQLAATSLGVFRCPEDQAGPPAETNYLLVVGPETAWPGARCVRLDEISDGASNTILLVEVRQSGIAWMEPRDLHVLQMAPGVNAKAGQGISSGHPGGANVAFADGLVLFLPDSLTPAELRGLLTIRGGEPRGPP